MLQLKDLKFIQIDKRICFHGEKENVDLYPGIYVKRSIGVWYRMNFEKGFLSTICDCKQHYYLYEKLNSILEEQQPT